MNNNISQKAMMGKKYDIGNTKLSSIKTVGELITLLVEHKELDNELKDELDPYGEA